MERNAPPRKKEIDFSRELVYHRTALKLRAGEAGKAPPGAFALYAHGSLRGCFVPPAWKEPQ